MASLLASPENRRRLTEADATLFLVGGYDGSGNYGDVLQLATAIETAAGLPGSPLVVPIVEHLTRDHHDALMQRYGQRFAAAAFAYFLDDGMEPRENLAELPPLESAKAALYIYGGGHLNGWWGDRKLAHCQAAQELAAGPALPVVASGLQVDEAIVAPGGVAYETLARASWLGARDIDSHAYLSRQFGGSTAEVVLAGDDAVPFLTRRQTDSDPVVNVHINSGTWVSEEPESLEERIATLLRELGRASTTGFELQPVIAYEDPRVSEREIAGAFVETEGGSLEGAGFVLAEPLDILDDALEHGLSTFRRARLTVCCSYHVALTSLLAGIPTVLLAQNAYYEQKSKGLRNLFQLEPGLVGIPGSPADVKPAVEALLEGPRRTAHLAHLGRHSKQVIERFERGRAALSVALTEALARSALEKQVASNVGRAEAAERELVAMRGTRGWRTLNRLRGVRNRFTHRPATGSAVAPEPPHVPTRTPPPDLQDQLDHIRNVAESGFRLGDHALSVAREMYLPAKMLSFMSWLELHPLDEGPMISVILATRNRPHLLADAIPSVIAQRYRNWELVVVDDGTDPQTQVVVAATEDDRVAIIEGPERGLGAARNAGLDRAGGDLVCYLDDDNIMHPRWLQAVALTFSKRPDVDVAYGVTLGEHRDPDDRSEFGWWPSLWQLPWSRETLLQQNLTDAGALAHRRNLPQAHFDETLSTGEDWELLIRLTADCEAFPIPALSHAYSMAGADRMSRDPQHEAGLDAIRRRYADT